MKTRYVMTFHVDVEDEDVVEFVNAITEYDPTTLFGSATEARLVDFHELPIRPDSPIR